MIRMLLTTTALAGLLTSAALAQTTITETPPPASLNAPALAPELPEDTSLRGPLVLSEGYSALSEDNLASRIIGASVYASAATDAEIIGDINDMVVGADGDVAAVIIGVGGFLGLGEKNVAVDISELKWTDMAEGDDRYVLETTKEALEAAPAFDWPDDDNVAVAQTGTAASPVEPAPLGNSIAPTNTMAPGSTTAPASTTTPAGAVATTAPFDRNTLSTVDTTTMRAEDLTGIAVYGVNDEQVGVIGDFILDATGMIDAVIIDVGGFLGLGAKEVAVGFENLNFSADAAGTRYLFLNTTKDQLEAQPAFDEASYGTNRDQQRMMVSP